LNRRVLGRRIEARGRPAALMSSPGEGTRRLSGDDLDASAVGFEKGRDSQDPQRRLPTTSRHEGRSASSLPPSPTAISAASADAISRGKLPLFWMSRSLKAR